MTFIDTDEYLIPMEAETWHSLLERKKAEGIHVLQLLSSRGQPRQDLMRVVDHSEQCKDRSTRRPRAPLQPCLTKQDTETFLRLYNCDFIKPPKPKRFSRAMKQIYRPDFVLQHFVHYTTVTTDIARIYDDRPDKDNFTRRVQKSEW